MELVKQNKYEEGWQDGQAPGREEEKRYERNPAIGSKGE
jgi:hypothetical protein